MPWQTTQTSWPAPLPSYSPPLASSESSPYYRSGSLFWDDSWVSFSFFFAFYFFLVAVFFLAWFLFASTGLFIFLATIPNRPVHLALLAPPRFLSFRLPFPRFSSFSFVVFFHRAFHCLWLDRQFQCKRLVVIFALAICVPILIFFSSLSCLFLSHSGFAFTLPSFPHCPRRSFSGRWLSLVGPYLSFSFPHFRLPVHPFCRPRFVRSKFVGGSFFLSFCGVSNGFVLIHDVSEAERLINPCSVSYGLIAGMVTSDSWDERCETHSVVRWDGGSLFIFLLFSFCFLFLFGVLIACCCASVRLCFWSFRIFGVFFFFSDVMDGWKYDEP